MNDRLLFIILSGIHVGLLAVTLGLGIFIGYVIYGCQ
jgi:hypothetical protein